MKTLHTGMLNSSAIQPIARTIDGMNIMCVYIDYLMYYEGF